MSDLMLNLAPVRAKPPNEQYGGMIRLTAAWLRNWQSMLLFDLNESYVAPET